MKGRHHLVPVAWLQLVALNFVWAASPAVARVDSVWILRLLKELEPSALVEVAGYWKAGDDGGGLFRYHAQSGATPDDGIVFKPGHLPGRFVREPAGDAEPLAEWFGAMGDGRHADQAAINACVKRFGRVKLLAKTYAVGATPAPYNPSISYRSILLRPDCRIEGSGRDLTVVRLLDGTNPQGATDRQNYFALMSNIDFNQPVDNVVIRDLTLDGNFDGQNRHSTISAIEIRGGNALVERLNLRGYGTGFHPVSGSSRECFVVSQSLVFKHATGSRKAAVFRDLDFTAPGHNGSARGAVAEITHIVLGGAHNFGNYDWVLQGGKDPDFDPGNGGENDRNWWPSEGGLVEQCRIHDIQYDPLRQKSFLHGITVSNSDGVVIRGNRVENFDGRGFFTMSWHNRNTTIEHNAFLGVDNGISLQVQGDSGSTVQFPKHEGYRIQNNRIVLGAPNHSPYAPSGIHLFGGDLPAGPRLVDIVARSNTIEGRRFTNAEGQERFPVGINIQVMRDNLHAVRFERNTLEIPDFPAKGGSMPRVPYGLAIRYFPLARWQADSRAGKIAFTANRTKARRTLRPALVNWQLNNAPRWGNPDGSSASATERR